MSELSEHDAALEKALRMAESSQEFTPEERRALKKVAQFWRGLEAVGWISGVLKNGLVWVGIIAGSIFTFKGWLAEWLLGLIGGGK